MNDRKREAGNISTERTHPEPTARDATRLPSRLLLTEFLDGVGERLRRHRILELGSRLLFWSLTIALVVLAASRYSATVPQWLAWLVLGAGIGAGGAVLLRSSRPPRAEIARYLDERLEGQDKYATLESCLRNARSNSVEEAFLGQVAVEASRTPREWVRPLQPPWEAWGTLAFLVALLVFALLWSVQWLMAFASTPPSEAELKKQASVIAASVRDVEKELQKPEAGEQANEIAKKLASLLQDLSQGKTPDPEKVKQSLLELPQVAQQMKSQGLDLPSLDRVAKFLSQSGYADQMQEALEKGDVDKAKEIGRKLASVIRDTGAGQPPQKTPSGEQGGQQGAQDQQAAAGPDDSRKSGGDCDKPGGTRGGKGSGAGAGASGAGTAGGPGAQGSGAGGGASQSANVTLSNNGGGSAGGGGSSGGSSGSQQGAGGQSSSGTGGQGGQGSSSGQPGGAAGGQQAGPGGGSEGGQQAGQAGGQSGAQQAGAGGTSGQQPGQAGGAGAQQPGQAGTEAGQQPGTAGGQQAGQAGGQGGAQQAGTGGASGQQPGQAGGAGAQQPGQAGTGAGQQPGQASAGAGQQPGTAGGQQAGTSPGAGAGPDPGQPGGSSGKPGSTTATPGVASAGQTGPGKSSPGQGASGAGGGASGGAGAGAAGSGAGSAGQAQTGPMTAEERKLMDKLQEIASAKGKSPSEVLREMGKLAASQSRGSGKSSAAFKDSVKKLVESVKGQDGTTGRGARPGSQGQGGGTPPPMQPGVAPAMPEGTLVQLDPKAQPGGDSSGTSPEAGGVAMPGAPVLPAQIDDPDERAAVEQKYEEETARYLSRERVPAEYRDLIKDYFSSE